MRRTAPPTSIPALLRPGRFDRSIHFDVPNRSGRREIVDYYLNKKAHVPELDKDERRDQLAAMTFGYTPVMIEHLFDEALVWSLRDGRDAMDWNDVQQAKLTEEIGLKQPVEYSDEEKRTIATHEAGHAVVAYLVGHDRKLEVLSIIKRRDALGLLAHSDNEERYTRTRSELIGAMKIAFGGMTAEELFFGESGTGPAGDLAHATHVRRADGRLVRDGRLAGVVRSDRDRADHAGDRRQGARERREPAARSSVCSSRRRTTSAAARRQPAPRGRAARRAARNATSWSATRSSTSCSTRSVAPHSSSAPPQSTSPPRRKPVVEPN